VDLPTWNDPWFVANLWVYTLALALALGAAPAVRLWSLRLDPLAPNP
jgi:hypothetical protein